MKTKSLKQFLSEGLIKLPPKMTAEMIDFAAYWYICITKARIIADDSNEQWDANHYADLARIRYKLKDLSNVDLDFAKSMLDSNKRKTLSFKLKLDDLPKEYLAKVAKKLGTYEENFFNGLEKKSIQIYIYANSPPILGTAYAHYDNDNQRIVIATDKFYTSANNSRYKLEYALDKFVGIIEHELTHAIQRLLFTHLNKVQVSSIADRTDDYSYDDYVNSQIEFDPHIKHSIAEVKSMINILNKTRSNENISPSVIIQHFTGAKLDSRLYNKPSAFYISLKKRSITKWKQACKLLTIAILGKPK